MENIVLFWCNYRSYCIFSYMAFFGLDLLYLLLELQLKLLAFGSKSSIASLIPSARKKQQINRVSKLLLLFD